MNVQSFNALGGVNVIRLFWRSKMSGGATFLDHLRAVPQLCPDTDKKKNFDHEDQDNEAFFGSFDPSPRFRCIVDFKKCKFSLSYDVYSVYFCFVETYFVCVSSDEFSSTFFVIYT